MNSLSYQKATSEDIDYLFWLREETMTEHLLKSRIAATKQDHLDRIFYRFDAAELILLKGQRIGLLKVFEDSKRIELIQIQLEPKHQGKGIGRKIINSLIEKSSREGKPLSLSVLKANKAKTLYESLGFKQVEETAISVTMEINNTTCI
ncbi:GNAT family N-acetyltransferase [Pontibacter sp. H259]|uniref:GNAT family N-acetyltransferase n=1 Tax=Pontibacter sp. H259 TaxID=3133421 RepID=UPI0030C42582